MSQTKKPPLPAWFFYFMQIGQSIPLILHQIGIDIQFRSGYRENPSGGIAVGLEGPGILPFAKADQIVSSPAFSCHFAGSLSKEFFQINGSIMVFLTGGSCIHLVH